MTDTDRLRDLLEQAAPPSPDVDPTSRAAAVARRGRSARTRDRVLVTLAAVAVAAVAIAVPRIAGDGPDRVTPAPPTVRAEPCPAQPVDVIELGSVALPQDVVAVRSCPVSGPGDPLPTEPLTGAAAQAFADDVAALPVYEISPYCATADVALEPWALQLQTPDGELVTVGSTTRSCSSVAINGAFRSSAFVIAAFEGNLDRHRSGATGPLNCTAGDSLTEGAATWNASFDPATATAGIVCYRPDPITRTREYANWAGTLAADQLATVREDLAANLSTTPPGGTCSSASQRMLVLENADGDRAAYVDGNCTREFGSARGFWKPSAASEDAIAEALGGRLSR